MIGDNLGTDIKGQRINVDIYIICIYCKQMHNVPIHSCIHSRLPLLRSLALRTVRSEDGFDKDMVLVYPFNQSIDQ